MPALTALGAIKESEMSAAAGTAWLFHLLILAGAPPQPEQHLGTHSLKCTFLSWAAKYGVSAANRRLLGQHCKSKD
eukprot:1130676-Amphidinium_carterae.1